MEAFVNKNRKKVGFKPFSGITPAFRASETLNFKQR